MKLLLSFLILINISHAEKLMPGHSTTIVDNEAYVAVKKLSLSDPVIEKFFNEIKNCVDKKDSDCLTKLAVNPDHIKNMLKYIEIAETPKFCRFFLNRQSGYTDVQKMDEIINEYTVKESPLVWRKIGELTQLYKKDVNIVYTTDQFQSPEEILLERTFTRELPCENSVDLKMKFTRINSQWKITDFVTYQRAKK
ncbi:MAG: hypothetical protein H7177_11085 [Rhizobacter sp.]|nr:hypothetical protein [Bacteriovorax sp.]